MLSCTPDHEAQLVTLIDIGGLAGIAWCVIVPTEEGSVAAEEERLKPAAINRHCSEALCDLTFEAVEVDPWGRSIRRRIGFVKIRLDSILQ